MIGDLIGSQLTPIAARSSLNVTSRFRHAQTKGIVRKEIARGLSPRPLQTVQFQLIISRVALSLMIKRRRVIARLSKTFCDSRSNRFNDNVNDLLQIYKSIWRKYCTINYIKLHSSLKFFYTHTHTHL